ncbi:MAG TPA: hypothetical protein VFK07_01600 [Candidatus Paceibacterota bacterium]|nr:hypothetical protein [Candidatus Paceibacterota bacterium]
MGIIAKIKKLVKSYEGELLLVICLILTAGIGFNIGLIKAKGNPISAGAQTAEISQTAATPAIPTATPDPRVVVSKSSKSKVYHYSWCSGAKSIADKNKVWYPTAAAAQAAGYTLAANCKEY